MSRAKSTISSLAQGEIRSTQGLPVVNPHAAGADIGAQQIFVCIPGPDQTQIVRSFGIYTADLHTLADWLVENGIQTIAMESTGVYWIPLFEVLEDHGIHCCLISGNLARRLPARHKTDVLDCQWIQTLHSLGLLKLSPNNQITGGKIIRSSTGKSHNRARQAFLQAAASVAQSDCAFGAFYRRLKARVGPAQAQVATAHKIARVVYHLLKYQVEYRQTTAQEYEQQFREREIRHLQRKAARLGFSLTPIPEAGSVS
jgi:hypothetical protein